MTVTTVKRSGNKQVKTTVTTWTPRKATFDVTGSGNQRVFTPRNKRAHTVMKKIGKRTKATLSELKATNGKGSYVLCTVKNGVVSPIKF